MILQNLINEIYDNNKTVKDTELDSIAAELISGLNSGKIRAAERGGDSKWNVNEWVKKGILLLFRYGHLKEMSIDQNFKYFDKHTIPLKPISIGSGIRIVPGGSSIRTGSYVAPGVICMPPMYINIGAYVDEGSMVDSHALIGTCAQIGKRVHVSAAAQVGGVLEPPGARPVIIEDEVLIGGNCGIYEGVLIRRRAVLGSGVILTSSTKVYDLVNETVLKSSSDSPLEIPEAAVLVPGTRALVTGFGKEHGLSISTPLIIKYRDEKTDAKTALEISLR